MNAVAICLTVITLAAIASQLATIYVACQMEKKHNSVMADLLDRVMARSYGEYVQSRPQAPVVRRTSRVLTDAELALREEMILRAASDKA